LCRAVRFTATAETHDVSACHCSMCRRWSGGVLLFQDVIGAPEFEGRDNIGVYKSSEWGERGFCKTCGSSLYWKVAGKDHYTLAAGCFDDASQLRFATEIYIEDKPAYYDFSNDTLKQTGAEAMAAYTGDVVIGEGVKS